MVRWGQILAVRAGHPGGLLPFCQGGWELCSVIFYLFLVCLSMGVGLGIGLNWLNRVEPSLTQWITGGVLHKMRGAGFCLFFHLMEEVII